MTDPLRRAAQALLDRWNSPRWDADLIRDLRVALDAPDHSAWQPIETAPKDGREIILCQGSRVGAANWCEWPDDEYAEGGASWSVCFDGDTWDGDKAPTHWMPLPPSPTTEESSVVASQAEDERETAIRLAAALYFMSAYHGDDSATVVEAVTFLRKLGQARSPLPVLPEDAPVATPPGKMLVDAAALAAILNALNGPGHYIRELQVTRNLPGPKGPIDQLIADYRAHFDAAMSEEGDAT